LRRIIAPSGFWGTIWVEVGDGWLAVGTGNVEVGKSAVGVNLAWCGVFVSEREGVWEGVGVKLLAEQPWLKMSMMAMKYWYAFLFRLNEVVFMEGLHYLKLAIVEAFLS
jgi:hypothetical protein